MLIDGWQEATDIPKYSGLHSEGVNLRKGVAGGPSFYQRRNAKGELEFAAVWPDGTVKPATVIEL
jgi:hypothetical protein